MVACLLRHPQNSAEICMSENKTASEKGLIRKAPEDNPRGQRYFGSIEKSDRSSLRWLSYGIEFTGVLGLFTYGGYWADQKLNNQGPWLMITGLLIGLVGMIYLLIKETCLLNK